MLQSTQLADLFLNGKRKHIRRFSLSRGALIKK